MIGRNSPVEASEECAAFIFEDLFGYPPQNTESLAGDNEGGLIESTATAEGGDGVSHVMIYEQQSDMEFYEDNVEYFEEELVKDNTTIEVQFMSKNSTSGEPKILSEDVTGISVGEAIALVKDRLDGIKINKAEKNRRRYMMTDRVVNASEECAAAIFKDLFGYAPSSTKTEAFKAFDGGTDSMEIAALAKGADNVSLVEIYAVLADEEFESDDLITITVHLKRVDTLNPLKRTSRGESRQVAMENMGDLSVVTMNATGLTVGEAIAHLKGQIIAMQA